VTRIFPFVLGGYLLTKRRWRVLIYSAVYLVISCLVTVSLTGIRTALGFFSASSYNTSRAQLDADYNVALLSFVSRLVWHSISDGETFRLAAVGLSWLVALGLAVVASIRQGSSEDPDWRCFSLWLVSSVMLFPSSLWYYLIVLVVLFSQLTYAGLQGRASNRAMIAGALSYIFIRYRWLVSLVLRGVGAPESGIYVVIEYTWFWGLLAAYVSAYWFVVDFRSEPLSAEAASTLVSRL
jgi:hypothetical protein